MIEYSAERRKCGSVKEGNSRKRTKKLSMDNERQTRKKCEWTSRRRERWKEV